MKRIVTLPAKVVPGVKVKIVRDHSDHVTVKDHEGNVLDVLVKNGERSFIYRKVRKRDWRTLWLRERVVWEGWAKLDG